MKTLSKSPGIYLLGKGEKTAIGCYNHETGITEVQDFNEHMTHKLKAVPLSQLTEEQVSTIVANGNDLWDEIYRLWIEEKGKEPWRCVEWTPLKGFKLYINHLLHQNNLPELRDGVCENCWGKAHLLTCDVGEPTQTEAYKELIKVCAHYTKLSDILIDIP